MHARPPSRFAVVLAIVALVLTAAGPAAAAPRRDRTPPTTPTNLRVTATTQTSVSLAWNASTDNSGSLYYIVSGDPLAGFHVVNPPATSVTFGDLDPGTSYTFHVQAWDAAYNSSGVSNASATTSNDTTPPTAPSGLTVQSVVGSQVLLSFTAGADDVTKEPLQQVLINGVVTPNVLSTDAPGAPRPLPAQRGFWVRHLEPSTTYTLTVRAVDGSGNASGVSNTATATTGPSSDTVAPTTPTLTRASDGGTDACPEELELEWTASSDDVDPAHLIQYEVWINGRINEVFTGMTDLTGYTEIQGPNVITIMAVDAGGNASAPSNAKTVQIETGTFCT